MKISLYKYSVKIIEKCIELGSISLFTLLIIKFTTLDPASPRDLAIAFFTAALIVFTASMIIRWVLSTPPLLVARKSIKNVYINVVKIVHNSPLVAKKYTAEERSTEKYKNAMKEQFEKSNRIYLRLISAHTMFYDDKERFIVETLRKFNREELKKKDIRIQLLDKGTKLFIERAHDFVKLLESDNITSSYDEYIDQCKNIENRLAELIEKKNISFYERKYLWRLHIFDNVIFISTYIDVPEAGGHLAPAYSFDRDCDASLFDGFLKEFTSLYEKPASMQTP